jgi:CheY-like chemotaxis protein
MKINQPKIFLVDDQEIVNFINKKLLSKIGHVDNVQHYEDPVEAYENVIDQSPSLVLLDLNMPILNGWEFLEKMANEPTKTKVIIVTSSTSELDRNKAKNYINVINYYTKPLNDDSLMELSHLLDTI